MRKLDTTRLSAPEWDVIVVGGGFAGLVMTFALAGRGHRVLLLEATERPLAAFRGELLHPRGMRTLLELGIEPSLAAAGAATVKGFAAFDGAREDPVLLPYRTSILGAGFEHARLVSVLRAALGRLATVRYETKARVAELVRERGRVVGVVREGGQVNRAALVIGADGRFSRVRRLLGVPTASAVVSHTFALEVPAVALPVRGHGHVFTGTPGPVLAYPISAERARICVDVPLGMASGLPSIVAFLRDRYARYLPARLRAAVTESLEHRPLLGAPNHVIDVGPRHTAGVVLAGDAAGCSHPLAATGMLCAVHDAEALVESFDAHGLSDLALAAYRKRREPFTTGRAMLADALHTVLGGRGHGPEALRAGIFRYWRASERARTASMLLLSGEESKIVSFLLEYGRVLGASSAEAFANGAFLSRPGAVMSALSAMFTTASLSVASAARRTVA